MSQWPSAAQTLKESRARAPEIGSNRFATIARFSAVQNEPLYRRAKTRTVPDHERDWTHDPLGSLRRFERGVQASRMGVSRRCGCPVKAGKRIHDRQQAQA